MKAGVKRGVKYTVLIALVSLCMGKASALTVDIDVIATQADVQPVVAPTDSLLFLTPRLVNGQLQFEAGGVPGLTDQGFYSGYPGGPYDLIYPAGFTPPGRPEPAQIKFFQHNGTDTVALLVSADPAGGGFVDLYRDAGSAGQLTPLLQEGDFRPEVGGTFTGVAGIFDWGLAGNDLVFRGAFDTDGESQTGLYTMPASGGVIQPLLAQGEAWPDDGANTIDTIDFSPLGYDAALQQGVATVFDDDFNTSALIQFGPGQSPSVLIESNGGELPGDAIGSFYDIIGGAQVDGADVIFRARDFDNEGIFGFIDGELTRIVDTQTPVPGGTPGQVFTGFTPFGTQNNPYSFQDGRVLFEGDFTGTFEGDPVFLSGLYLWDDGEIFEVARSNNDSETDTLILLEFSFSEHALEDDTAAFGVLLADTVTNALYGEIWQATFTADRITGDYNSDGFVSQGDLDLVLLNWGDTLLPAGFDGSVIPGGFTFDGLISQNELDGVLLNWGDGTPPALVIPEPTTAGVLVMLVGLVVRLRGRQGR